MIQNEVPEVSDLQDVTENWLKYGKTVYFENKALFICIYTVCMFIMKMCPVTLNGVQSKMF